MLRRIRRHLTPSALAALIAFAVAGGSVGYAAAKIDGGDIVNGSLSSADIKDSSLQAKDLSSKARDSLEGRAGAPGATGPAGPRGADGSAGPSGQAGADAFSNVISRRKANAVPGTGGLISVFSETLTAGSYALQAKADISGIPPGNAASCQIKVNGNEIDRTNAFSPVQQNQGADKISQAPTIVTFAAFRLTQTRTVLFQCEVEGADGNATNGSLLITKVNSVTRTSDITDPAG